ncbi:hypothetical protein ABZS88_44410 [Streptomyces sp. NPDC005480]|uniref:hypothetical protein n=1 Tax=Streptomyces sp. NPDC005480 TaxID=3154880 RepID=UPI0033A46DAB
MTAMTVRPAPAIDLVGRTSEAVRLRSDEPIYAALAVHWSAAGRVVPGQTDREWTMLASRCLWPIR